MPRLPLLLSFVTAGVALAAPAAAESYPPPAVCDASVPLPAVTELPAGCPLTTFAPYLPSDVPVRRAEQPYVYLTPPRGGGPELTPTATAYSAATMPAHIAYCSPATCEDRVLDGDIEATRYDVVLLVPPPVGALLEYGDGTIVRQIRVTAPAACPPVIAPPVSCELPQCGSPEAHCMRPGPGMDCGTGWPSQDAGPDAGYDYPDYPDYPDDHYHDDVHGCSSSGAAAASPLVLLALAIGLRRRWRRS
jgi:uncharacterized protein (TIGR03382 family)